jgi:B-cell receptor-associated protein 31
VFTEFKLNWHKQNNHLLGKVFYFLNYNKLISSSAAAVAGHERSEVQARKFYSQRNMYLCGFTLFLSLILNRTYIMILDVLRLEEKVKRLEGNPANKDSVKLDRAGDLGEIGRLKNELAKKDANMEALKKQVEGLQREYGAMGDRVSAQDNVSKKDR